jgi:uncharacterized protein YbjQ (UPF0145 family)
MNSEARDALRAVSDEKAGDARSITSDLSIDESLLLHSAGWEPTDVVSGTAVWSVPYGAWLLPYGQSDPSELSYASQATTEAIRAASERIRQDCVHSGGQGVVGVEVDLEIESNSIQVSFTGTAVRPIGTDKRQIGRPFVTDLSSKDFVLLERAGWVAVDLAYGASFVAAPFQRLRQFVAQATQNVELVNLTKALQNAREIAMDRMQRAALAPDVAGVVNVSIRDGTLHHSRHVLAFICWGTTVRLAGERHQRIEPELVLPLNDDLLAFEATSLRGSRRRGG